MLPEITLTGADTEGMDWLEGLLQENDLPHQDIRTGAGQFFIAHDGPERVGAAGLEIDGENGLLRSVVVVDAKRGQGYGTALCDALEARARTNGVETLYLLTTTASAFFDEHGYDVIDREAVPPEIRETTEFAELCPRSATCMGKTLDS